MSHIEGYVNTPVRVVHKLPVGNQHILHVEECGNPDGVPVIFLHGGPGGAVSESSRRFFDPSHYRIILFDQRGCGQSTPFLTIQHNTLQDSVADMEQIRRHLGIERWLVFGGSYGTTLALAYAIEHAERVMELILRGIFLGRDEDIQWLFQAGASYFYPCEFARFKEWIEPALQHDLVTAYYQAMLSEDEATRERAYQLWNGWESAIVTLMPNLEAFDEPLQPHGRTIALYEAHYFANHMFWEDDQYILSHATALQDVPMAIFHGRYDVDCRVSGAYDLAQACPQAKLNIVELGAHSPYETPMFHALCDYMEQLKQKWPLN